MSPLSAMVPAAVLLATVLRPVVAANDPDTISRLIGKRFHPSFFAKALLPNASKYIVFGTLISSNGWPLYYFNLTGSPSMKDERLDSARISLRMSSKIVLNQRRMLRFAIMDMNANSPKMSLYDIPHRDHNLLLNVTLQTRALRSRNRNIMALGILNFDQGKWHPVDFQSYIEVSDPEYQPLMLLETTKKAAVQVVRRTSPSKSRLMRNIRHNHGSREQEPLPESEDLMRPGNVLYEAIKSRIEVRVFVPTTYEESGSPKIRHHHLRSKVKYLNQLLHSNQQRARKRTQERVRRKV